MSHPNHSVYGTSGRAGVNQCAVFWFISCVAASVPDRSENLWTSMNTSVIRYRVADFLKSHAPFDALPGPHLMELAGQGRVKFHEADEYIFRQGQAKTPWVWIIQQGRVELVDETSGVNQLRDVLGEGDILGL